MAKKVFVLFKFVFDHHLERMGSKNTIFLDVISECPLKHFIFFSKEATFIAKDNFNSNAVFSVPKVSYKDHHTAHNPTFSK